MSLSTTDVFDATTSWRLSPMVSLRDEAFGALAYHHGTRRLVFLKSTELVGIVRRLDDYDSAELAIDALVPAPQRSRYLSALASLVSSEILSGR